MHRSRNKRRLHGVEGAAATHEHLQRVVPTTGKVPQQCPGCRQLAWEGSEKKSLASLSGSERLKSEMYSRTPGTAGAVASQDHTPAATTGSNINTWLRGYHQSLQR